MNDIVEEFNIDSDGSDSDESVDINGNEIKKSPQTCARSRPESVKTIMSRFQTGKFIRPLVIAAFVQTFIHLDDWVGLTLFLRAFFSSGYHILRKCSKTPVYPLKKPCELLYICPYHKLSLAFPYFSALIALPEDGCL